MHFTKAKISVTSQGHNFWTQGLIEMIDTAFESWDFIFSDYEYVRSSMSEYSTCKCYQNGEGMHVG